jgi:hypothetical protein
MAVVITVIAVVVANVVIVENVQQKVKLALKVQTLRAKRDQAEDVKMAVIATVIAIVTKTQNQKIKLR